jgi:hypothetical protein
MSTTKGDWKVIREKQRKLPAIHVIVNTPSDTGKITYLASIHETLTEGEDMANAIMMSASRAMYEAITIGLTGMDLDGNVIGQAEAMKKLKAAKEKAEGK